MCIRRYFVSSQFLALALLLLSANPSPAQWSVHGPPVTQPVPQYRPPGYSVRYPLADPPAEELPEPPSARKDADRRTPPRTEETLPDVAPNPVPVPAPSIDASPSNRLPVLPQTPQPRPAPLTPPASAAAPKKQAPTGHAPRVADGHAIIDYRIYRDRNPLPIDPRKPCGPCTNPSRYGCDCCQAYGFKGRPYQEQEIGGCRCVDKKIGQKRPMFSVYWPRPFSAKLDDRFPAKASERYQPCQKDRIVDVFDKLESFKLIDYQRRDNGYVGPDSDPYGCLGENRQLSRVAGVGYRFPSQPAAPAGAQPFVY